MIVMVGTETKKVKVECDLCDGCGWYEGGETIMTTCGRCEGKGFIYEEREVEIQHEWVEGVWNREGKKKHYLRVDHCKLCGCERTYLSTFTGKQGFIAHYERSGILFGANEMPSCWGAKTPK